MFETGITLTLITVMILSFVAGVIYTKRLMRNRYADVFEVFGQKDLAQQLREDDIPVVTYRFQAGLLGTIVGLVTSFIWPTVLYFTGQDLFEYRRTLMPVLASCMVVGFLVATVAGWFVARRKRG